MKYDVAIVGAGASGLVAAIRLKQLNPELKVALLELKDRVGKKLITTGNGRCNITNKFADESKYHGDNLELVPTLLGKYGVAYTTDFFESIGVNIVFEKDGRAYPNSYQASSVVDALRFTCEEKGIDILLECQVNDFTKNDNIVLNTSKGNIVASKVIVATGLFSGNSGIAENKSMFSLLKDKGFKVSKTTPAIVQIKTKTDTVKQLKGIKVDANAKLVLNGKILREEYGEVLFTEYGLSGPPILQISREVSRQTGNFTVCLDLFNDYSYNEVCELLFARRENIKNRIADNFLTGFINKKIGQVILKKENIDTKISSGEIEDKSIYAIAKNLKSLEFSVVGSMSFANSQVTAGGIFLKEIDNKMESKLLKGLYLIGEILDIDGDCGGYNLQWAFTSAFAAAEAIAEEYKC